MDFCDNLSWHPENLKNIKNIDYSNCIITFQNGDKTTLFAVATKKELREHARNI